MNTWISTGNLATVSDKAASSISNGRPWKSSSNLDSHLSKADGVICEALGPSTSSSVLLHHTEKAGAFDTWLGKLILLDIGTDLHNQLTKHMYYVTI